MALHPRIAEALASLPAPPEGPLDPLALRAAESVTITDPIEDTVANGVPVRVYRRSSDGIIVYLHGGAFFLGSLDTHDHVARTLAEVTGLTVVSVDYRRAPESAFPAGLEDCLSVVHWAAENGGGSTLALVGDSSGGNFVAAVAALAHDEGFDAITHQVLYYPSLDLDFDESRYASLRENAVGYGLETAGLAPFNSFYLESGADPADPRVSPIKRRDLSGLPPALVITGEHDPLRDEGELYGELLARAGVPTTVTRYAGAAHGFVQHFSWIPEYHEAFEETARFLKGGVA